MVRPRLTGSLASASDATGLGRALLEVLDAEPSFRLEMSANCRRIAVEEYAPEVQAQSYGRLYREMAPKREVNDGTRL